MGRSRAPGTRPPPTPPLLSLLSLLLLFPAVRGDCGLPPEIPNATPSLSGKTSFSVDEAVFYRCNDGFQNIPDKPATVTCLENGSWSSFETFCNRSCGSPPVVSFAAPQKEFISMNYFPVGTVVKYECLPGHYRVSAVPATSTCLENLEWTKVNEACKKKPCPNPGELPNGHIDTSEDILFGSKIVFSCNTGYRLVGSASSYCVLDENTLRWSSPLPQCIVIHCPDPPKIDNGGIREESDSYVYRQVVTYVCAKGFILVGNSSIYCTVNNNNEGQWSDPPPKCTEKFKIPTTPRKPTTVHVPSTRVPPTPQRPTTVNGPGTTVSPKTQRLTTVNVADTTVSPKPQRPTTVNAPVTPHVPATKVTAHHPTKTSKDKEKPSSGADHLIYVSAQRSECPWGGFCTRVIILRSCSARPSSRLGKCFCRSYGHTCLITLTVLHAMLSLIG